MKTFVYKSFGVGVILFERLTRIKSFYDLYLAYLRISGGNIRKLFLKNNEGVHYGGIHLPPPHEYWSLLKLPRKNKDAFSNYDMEMIWQTIPRVGNMAEIKNVLRLNYAPLKERLACGPSQRTNGASDGCARRKVVLFFEFRRLDAIEEAMLRISRVSDCANIYVATDTEEKKEAWELEKAGLFRKEDWRMFWEARCLRRTCWVCCRRITSHAMTI
ncbi:MAG: rhamnan synthesis F family protein [Treponema sp.]|nr:rhamnan synthesis F family protein [Treponema sp.]